MEDKVYPIMSWVTELTPHLLFGPPPKTLDELGYLVTVRHISHIINVCDKSSNQRTAKGYKRDESYKMYFDTFGDDYRPLAFAFPLEIGSFQATGRLKSDQLKNAAQHYLKHARTIVTHIEKHPKGNRFYLHQKTGFDQEVYVAFAVWLLWCNPEGVDPLAWLKEGNHDILLDRDPDKLALLAEIWKEGVILLKAKSMFTRSTTVKKPKISQ